MNKPGINELLIACVLDPAMLQRVRQFPESVFTEYELSDHARELLTSPDERLLELLGQAIQQQSDAPHSSESPDPPGTMADAPDKTAVVAERMPESRLALRLVPYLQQNIDATAEIGKFVINYAGHLDQLQADSDFSDLPAVPEAAVPGQALPPLGVVVAVQPHTWTDANGNQQITFSVNARLPQDIAVAPVADTGSNTLSPWRHNTSSAEVEKAATEVLTANTQSRRQKILALIDAMVTPHSVSEAD